MAVTEGTEATELIGEAVSVASVISVANGTDMRRGPLGVLVLGICCV